MCIHVYVNHAYMLPYSCMHHVHYMCIYVCGVHRLTLSLLAVGLRFSVVYMQVESGNEEVVRELLELGANVDLQDNVSVYIVLGYTVVYSECICIV